MGLCGLDRFCPSFQWAELVRNWAKDYGEAFNMIPNMFYYLRTFSLTFNIPHWPASRDQEKMKHLIGEAATQAGYNVMCQLQQ